MINTKDFHVFIYKEVKLQNLFLPSESRWLPTDLHSGQFFLGGQTCKTDKCHENINNEYSTDSRTYNISIPVPNVSVLYYHDSVCHFTCDHCFVDMFPFLYFSGTENVGIICAGNIPVR